MRALYWPLAALVIVTSCPSPSLGQTSALDSLLAKEMAARRIPGVAVAVIENGITTVERAYGTANLETGTPLRTDAIFELASVTKQFTAAAIMLLVEGEKVALDESIDTYIDDTPESWRNITVRQLLTHTAGLDTSAVPRIEGSAPLYVTTQAAFRHVSAQAPRFSPGQEGWYGDAGYFLLGMIIERASGQSYREFIERRIFEPLQMSRSSILDKVRVLEGRVPTYSLRGGEHVHWRRDWDFELPSFMGIFSTLSDVAKWDESLRGTTFLREQSLAQMWTPAKVDNGNAARVLDKLYGFGFELDDLRGRRTVGHGGASGTYLLHFLDEPLTVIVLTNLDMPSGGRHATLLARAIAGVVRPELTPPELLTPATDRTPAATAAIESLLADLAADRSSSMFAPALERWWSTAFGRRTVLRNQLRDIGSLTYLGSDEVASQTLWDADPLARLVYYRAQAGDRVQQVTVGLTAAGQVGRLDVPFQSSP